MDTRFLQVIGTLCYKPIFAGGATTPSPIFRIIQKYNGTLILDEADFKASEDWNEMIKILNCGYMKGFPVLRSEKDGKSFKVRAYDVYGTKLIATRRKFKDRALESRCLTKILTKANPRKDIPIIIPPEFQKEGLEIRNKLLTFKFQQRGKVKLKTDMENPKIEARINQIAIPLLSIIKDKEAIEEIKQFLERYNKEIIEERRTTKVAEILEIIINIGEPDPEINEIKNRYNKDKSDKEKKSSRGIGYYIREVLKFKTKRKSGSYRVIVDRERLYELIKRYGIKLENFDMFTTIDTYRGNKNSGRTSGGLQKKNFNLWEDLEDLESWDTTDFKKGVKQDLTGHEQDFKGKKRDKKKEKEDFGLHPHGEVLEVLPDKKSKGDEVLREVLPDSTPLLKSYLKSYLSPKKSYPSPKKSYLSPNALWQRTVSPP